MPTVLNGQDEFKVDVPSADSLWLDAAETARVTGFVLKSAGLCKGDICVPVRGRDFVDADGRVNIEAFWRFIGNPVVHDDLRETFVLGTGAGARTQALESLDAPDFRLPDVDGHMHALSDQRGNKVLLVTWAAW